jgi:hypothetical protein
MLPRPCALVGLNAGGVPLATLAQKARSWSLPWVRGRVVRRRQVGSTPPRHVVDQRCRKGTPVPNPAGKGLHNIQHESGQHPDDRKKLVATVD